MYTQNYEGDPKRPHPMSHDSGKARKGLAIGLLLSCWSALPASAQTSLSTQGSAAPESVPTSGAFPPPPPYLLTPPGPPPLSALATPSPAGPIAVPTSASPSDPAATPSATPSAIPPSPYSLPFGLRPIIPVSVLRLDSVFAFYQQNIAPSGEPEQLAHGFTGAFLPTIGYRFHPAWMGVVRFGVVGNRPPRITGNEAGADNCEDQTTVDPATMQTKTVLTKCGVASTNIQIGGFYSHKLGSSVRLSFFAATTIPVGSGVSAASEPGASGAEAPAGQLSRSAMDNVMFAVNDWALVEGIDVAYIAHRLTVQAEVTFFELFRARNELTNPDVFKSNFTAGLHIGYFFASVLSLGAELRYQRWLTDPKAVLADEANADKGLPMQGLRQNLSLAIGPRFHIKLPGGHYVRPALAYEPGLSGVLATRKYHTLQVDIPIVF